MRTSSSAPPSSASSAAAFVRVVDLAGSRAARAARARLERRRDEVARAPRGPASSRPCVLRGLEERARVDAVRDGHLDGFASPAARSRARSIASSIRRRWSASVERLARDLLGGDRARGRRPRRGSAPSARCVSASIWRLRLLEPALAVLLGLLAHALALRVGDACAPRRGSPRPRLRACCIRLAVLLEQPARLVAGVVGLVERLADPVAPLVDHLLDRAERVPPQHEERDREADERPDHQARDRPRSARCRRRASAASGE